MGGDEDPPDPEEQGCGQHSQQGNAGRLQLPLRLVDADQFLFRKAGRTVVLFFVIVFVVFIFNGFFLLGRHNENRLCLWCFRHFFRLRFNHRLRFGSRSFCRSRFRLYRADRLNRFLFPDDLALFRHVVIHCIDFFHLALLFGINLPGEFTHEILFFCHDFYPLTIVIIEKTDRLCNCAKPHNHAVSTLLSVK